MLVTMCICIIVGAIAVLNVQTTSRAIRLHESGTEYANLLQNARIRAVKDNRYYTVLTDTSVNPPRAFVDINGTGVYANGDPVMVFASGVSPMPFVSGPGLNNLKSQFLPPGATAQGSVNTATAGPTFGARGLPCTPNGGVCPYLTVTNTVTSYVTFIQNVENGKWEAITVNPAGRIRKWAYGSSSWSPLN
jgi:Tfp pilus assembly protein FimT